MDVKSIYGNPICDDIARKDTKKLKDDYVIMEHMVDDRITAAESSIGKIENQIDIDRSIKLTKYLDDNYASGLSLSNLQMAIDQLIVQENDLESRISTHDYDIAQIQKRIVADKAELEAADRELLNSINNLDSNLQAVQNKADDNELAISQKVNADDLEFYVKRDIEFNPYSNSLYGDTDFDEIAKSSVLGRVNRKRISTSTYTWEILHGDKVCCDKLDLLKIGITIGAQSQTDFDDFVASIHFTSTENTAVEFLDGFDGAYATIACLITGEDCISNEFIPVANKRYNITVTYDGLYLIYYVSGVELP